MRKLTWATLSYALSIFLMHYILPDNGLYGIIGLCIIIGCIGLMKFQGNLRTGILLVCVFSVLGVLRYEQQVASKLESVEPYIGNEYRISAVITEYPVMYEDCVKLTVRLDTDLIPSTKAIFYDYTSGRTACLPGDYIRANVRFASALTSAGEETDSYISKGIYLRGYITDDVRVYDQQNMDLQYLPLKLGQWVRDCINRYMSPDSSAFLNALLTGDKTALYNAPELNNTLTRAGIAHIVAVSGMHVSFVIGVSMLLFGHRMGWILSILLMGLFAFLTGLSPSVLRAVFMQLLFLLAPVLRRESDGITSISFALLILLIANPFAISSVSLQLSFLSMTGIIIITPKASEWLERKCPVNDGRMLYAYRFVTASLSASLGATLFTAPVCAYYFGSISLLSPLTNLLVLWIVPYCFTGGFILCALSLLSDIAANTFVYVLEWGTGFVFTVAKLISNSSLAAIYLPEGLMWIWYFVVYAVIGLLFFFKRNGMYRPLIPILTAVISFVSLCIYNDLSNSDGLTVTAVDVGQGQCIIAMEKEHTLMVDCGGSYDAGDRAARWLYSHGREQVDLLILTHFDEDHINGVVDLMTQIPIAEIIFCSSNLTDHERPMLDAIMHQAENRDTRLTIVNTQSALELGGMYTDLFVSAGEESNDGIIVSLRSGDFRMLVMGDADFDAEAYLLRSSTITDGDCLVVGHHGSKYSTGKALLERFKPEYAIISCGYNSYGHPTQEVLDRLTAQNVVIYRTDQMGTIEIEVR